VSEPVYVCGHSPAELSRLQTQGAFFGGTTRAAFEAAGLCAGHRILDIGCGAGDVSFLAADIVGAGGSVVGIDRAPAAIAAARARARAEGRGNVEFRLESISDMPAGTAFDAVVGRFVLMHQPDPSATLRAAAGHLRRGGVVVMIESVMSACVAGLHSAPHSTAYDRLTRLLNDIIRAGGADASMGLHLGAVFQRAGLAMPVMQLQAVVEGGPGSAIYGYMAESLRSVLPLGQELGVAGADQVDIDRLEAELRAEVMASGGVLVSPPIVAAWAMV